MNVTFHTLASLATATSLSGRQQTTIFIHGLRLTTGLAAGVLTHGLLDYLPHSYPINSIVDVALSLSLFSAALVFATRDSRVLLSACFIGAVLPDLVDLGPAILNKRFGASLRVVKIFPWHWPQYSGSIYDGSHSAESLIYHLLVVGISFALLYAYRDGRLWGRQKPIGHVAPR